MRLKKKAKRLLFLILALILVIIASTLGILFYLSSPVSNNSKSIEIIIPSGHSHHDIANLLKEKDLIKSKKMFIFYTKLYKVDNIYAAKYVLNQNMNLKEIIDSLENGGENPNQINISFPEGINIRKLASIVEENTNNTKEDFIKTINDKNYLDELINKYWFLTDEIKNDDIYYSLEGYLFPETYSFNSKDVTIKEIIETMLDEEERVLEKYKKQIDDSNYTIHELITLASVTQSETYDEDDFKTVASVFYNRLANGMSLGSCVTSYYGAKKEMTEELYQSEIDAKNPYNTRASGMDGKLPIGPISNPGQKALKAVFDPIDSDYYYFVSDKDNKLYFTKTFAEHETMIEKLQNEGKWYEW